MSYQIRFPNNLDIYAGAITLSGVDNSGNLIAPIVTASNVLCSNLYAERALTADGFAANSSVRVDGNVVANQFYSYASSGIPPFVVNSATQVDMLTSEFSGTSDNTNALNTTTTAVNVNMAAVPSVGQVLTATSASTAIWSTPSSGGSGNITSNAFTITNDPVADYILTGIDSGNVSWQAPASVSADSITGTTTATAAGTTTLVSTDDIVQVFTGSTTQTVKFPATTGKLGMTFCIVNMSTGSLTIQDSAANAVDTLPTIVSGTYRCVGVAGVAADWKKTASG